MSHFSYIQTTWNSTIHWGKKLLVGIEGQLFWLFWWNLIKYFCCIFMNTSSILSWIFFLGPRVQRDWRQNNLDNRFNSAFRFPFVDINYVTRCQGKNWKLSHPVNGGYCVTRQMAKSSKHFLECFLLWKPLKFKTWPLLKLHEGMSLKFISMVD